jgi:serine/threonine protein kinase
VARRAARLAGGGDEALKEAFARMTRHVSTLPSQIGRYRIVRAIGRGAMGQVLLAHDPVLERPVAIKHLRDDLSLTGEQFTALTKRMEQEARAAARVSHPNLVGLHDMGRDPIVGLFLVFEYVEGETLEERLKRGPLTAGEAARLARELGGALSEAHAAQVLHRDIKPENVLLSRMGAKIADFGIARLPDSSLTRPGGILGTPAYSAPEAIDIGSFSPESDQFSMACTLFEAISARRAFPGDDAVTVAGLVQTTAPAELARQFRLDERVDTLLARAFSKHPGARFASCEEFGKALAEALEMSPRSSMITQPDGYHRALTPGRQSRAGSVTGALLSTLALIAALGLVYKSGWRVSFAGGPAAAQPRNADEQELQPVVWVDAHPPAGPKSDHPASRPPVRDAGHSSAPDDAGAGAP